MPDTLNKQAIVNLLIDSPLREPIKINLIDIVNNTNEPDLPKVYSTITKELKIFQKATERRMKLADETIAKLGGTTPTTPTTAAAPAGIDLPPLPPVPTPLTSDVSPLTSTPSLSVPPLDLPPLPVPSVAPSEGVASPPAPTPVMPTPQPLGTAPMAAGSDEDALAEIQKELESLKSATAAEVSTDAAAPAPAATPTPQV